MTDLRFSSQYRIRRLEEYRQVFEDRCSASDGVILVYGRMNDRPYPRLGTSVSRKVGGAVARNRWKRLLREAFRLHRRELPVGVDLVVVPRPGAEPTLNGIAASLVRLAEAVARRLATRRRSSR